MVLCVFSCVGCTRATERDADIRLTKGKLSIICGLFENASKRNLPITGVKSVVELIELCRTYDLLPNESHDWNNFHVDFWGTPIRMERQEKRIRLTSAGRDRQFEGSDNDDLVMESKSK